MRKSGGTPWCGAGAALEGFGGGSSDEQKNNTETEILQQLGC